MLRVPPVPAALERIAGWAWRLIAVGIAAVVVVAALWYLRVIVLPAIIALTISPALTPIADALRRRGHERPAPAVALLVGLAAIAALIAIVAGSVVAQYDELAAAVQSSVDDIAGWLEGEPLNLSFDDRTDLESSLQDYWDEASGYLVSGVRTGLSVLTGTIIAVALLYFILRDGRALWRWVLDRFSPANRDAVDRAGRRAWTVLGGFVRGTALIAAIDAVLIGIGLWILGVPVAFSLAVLIFLGSFVPFVGATLSGLVAVLVAFADEGWVKALIALGIILGVQFLEGNFLQPIIQSRTVDLHAAVILLAVAAGGSLYGIVGAYLAVPVTAVVFTAVRSLAGEPVVAPPGDPGGDGG
ncbi:MAG TPA: AI-2E family transporter [Gaiellaceae bacterium]